MSGFLKFSKDFTCLQSWEGQATRLILSGYGLSRGGCCPGPRVGAAQESWVGVCSAVVYGSPSYEAMDVTCHCLSSEPPKRNIELLVAPKSVSSVEHISCLHV